MCAACVEAPHAFLYLLLLFVFHVIKGLIIIGVPPISFSSSTGFWRRHTRGSSSIYVCVTNRSEKMQAMRDWQAI